MSLPPTAVEKGLVLNTRTGALYGAAAGFAVGLVWQTIAGYENPVPLWRWLIVGGAVLGGSIGFGWARSGRTRA
jgi:hypothetical protein